MTWRRVSKQSPCVVCGKPDWCTVAADGAACCMRVQSNAPAANGGWIHRNGRNTSGETARPSAAELDTTMQRMRSAMTDDRAGAIATQLGVSVEALRALGVGFDSERNALAIPERDADGRIVGINFRASDGTRTHRGKRALIVPDRVDTGAMLYVVEGGTDALAALSIGLTAVGRPSCTGGIDLVRSFVKLRGVTHAVIVADADAPGRRGAGQLAKALAVDGIAVRIIEPPSPHKDLRDWIRAGATREAVIQLANDATPVTPSTKPAKSPGPATVPSAPASSALKRFAAVPPWRPFPVDALPAPIATFVREQAAALGVDPAMIAVPVLGVLAAAIGTTRRIELKRSWREPSVAWCVLVAKSGNLKSPAIDAAVAPVHALQRKAYAAAEALLPAYKAARAEYKRKHAEWKKSKCEGLEPEPPAEPVSVRYVVEDLTVEALVARLADQRDHRGLLLARDELSAVFAFDQYKQTRGADVAAYLKMHGARDVHVDRKTGDRTQIFVRRASLSIVGAIQPRTLSRALGEQHFVNGFAARCLFAMPPANPKRWTKTVPTQSAVGEYHRIVEQLYRLSHRPGFGDDAVPVDVPLSPEAEPAWAAFYNDFGGVQLDARDDDHGAAYAKLEGYAARLALIVHCVRCIDDPAVTDDAVDAQSIRSGIELARWFANETERVYAALRENEEQSEARWIIAWIERHGGSTTARDLARATRRYATVDDARAALEQLAAAGLGRWVHRESGPDGGRPSDAFELMPRADETSDPTPESEPRADETIENPDESGGSVDCRRVDTSAREIDGAGSGNPGSTFDDNFAGYADDVDPADCDAV